LGVNLDAAIAYRSGQATAMHFLAKNIVFGFDSGETSFNLATATMHGIYDVGFVEDRGNVLGGYRI
jgi:phosphomannomutase